MVYILQMTKSLLYGNIYKWSGIEITRESFKWMANSDMYTRYLKKKSRKLNKAIDEWFWLEYQWIQDEMKR